MVCHMWIFVPTDNNRKKVSKACVSGTVALLRGARRPDGCCQVGDSHVQSHRWPPVERGQVQVGITTDFPGPTCNF